MRPYEFSNFIESDKQPRVHIRFNDEDSGPYPATVFINTEDSWTDHPCITLYMTEQQLANFINSARASYDSLQRSRKK